MPPSCRRECRIARLAPLVVAACLSAATACSHDSYLVVTLLSGDSAFTGVGFVDVVVRSGTESRTLRYDTHTREISFDLTMSKTLSIAFTPSQSGPVQLTVSALRSDKTCIGTGSASNVMIKKADVSPATVRLVHNCPASDGGTPDGVTFAGCDPAMPEAMCQGNQTCFVNCSTSRGMCIAGGAKGPGETCATNNDCMPGTQCFDYGGVPGCTAGTKICLKFCSGDNQCSPGGTGTGGATGTGSGGITGAGGTSGAGGDATTPGGGGVGGRAGTAGSAGAGGNPGTGGAAVSDVAGSACRNPVVCSPTITTTYKTCTFDCDPRGDGTTGCPTGLLCFLYRDPTAGKPDSPDCGCREPSRMGTDGASCTSSATCAPGHICNLMSGTTLCRKLCKMSSPADCAAPKTCNRLDNNSVFGVCI